METRCRAEIEALHRFFEGWLAGRLPASEDAFVRLTAALAPGFRLVGPDGRVAERGALLDRLRAAHGAEPDGLRIWIERVRARPLGAELALVLYEEWQERPGAPARGRQSSALFQEEADAPGGVAWLHVHETWLPEGA